MKTATGLIVMGNWDSVMDERVFQNPDTETFGFKIYWSRMNPTDGVYDWSILNQNLLNCAKYKKKFTIELATGSWTPEFVYQKPYNVPKITFNEFKRASIPEPPLKEFNVPLFTNPNYKQCFKTFLNAFTENIKALKYVEYRDVMRLFVKISVSGVNETTAEYRINSQTNIKSGGVTSSNAVKIWKENGVSGLSVVDTLKEFYYLVDDILPRQEKCIYLLGKGFPNLDSVNVESSIADWVKATAVDNVTFAYTSVTETNNGGSLFEYIKSLGLKIGGELNQRLYESCDSETLDKVLNNALSGGFSFIQIRDDNVLNSPEVIKKYKNSFN